MSAWNSLKTRLGIARTFSRQFAPYPVSTTSSGEAKLMRDPATNMATGVEAPPPVPWTSAPSAGIVPRLLNA
ncbi:hypothetical protein AMK29_19055 [Streptomyces sp. CB02261]|nr:hypothetical protein AMK29_19055 [Streptomyces sp. CB02261]